MRLLLDTLAVLALLATIAGGVLVHRAADGLENQAERTADDLRRIDLEVKYRAVTAGAETNENGWPVSVEPGWFREDVPRNRLLPVPHPWLEVADDTQRELDHPPDRVALGERSAGFWYNPARGVVRARVPMRLSDQATLELYNRVNASRLESIFEVDPSTLVGAGR